MKKNTTATSTRLQIKKFEPTILSDKIASDSSPVICIIGKRNTGKSEVIRTLLYYNKQIPTAIIISPTEMGNKLYGSFCPDSFIHHRFNPDVLGRIKIDREREFPSTAKYWRTICSWYWMIVCTNRKRYVETRISKKYSETEDTFKSLLLWPHNTSWIYLSHYVRISIIFLYEREQCR